MEKFWTQTSYSKLAFSRKIWDLVFADDPFRWTPIRFFKNNIFSRPVAHIGKWSANIWIFLHFLVRTFWHFRRREAWNWTRWFHNPPRFLIPYSHHFANNEIIAYLTMIHATIWYFLTFLERWIIIFIYSYSHCVIDLLFSLSTNSH